MLGKGSFCRQECETSNGASAFIRNSGSACDSGQQLDPQNCPDQPSRLCGIKRLSPLLARPIGKAERDENKLMD